MIKKSKLNSNNKNLLLLGPIGVGIALVLYVLIKFIIKAVDLETMLILWDPNPLIVFPTIVVLLLQIIFTLNIKKIRRIIYILHPQLIDKKFNFLMTMLPVRNSYEAYEYYAILKDLEGINKGIIISAINIATVIIGGAITYFTVGFYVTTITLTIYIYAVILTTFINIVYRMWLIYSTNKVIAENYTYLKWGLVQFLMVFLVPILGFILVGFLPVISLLGISVSMKAFNISVLLTPVLPPIILSFQTNRVYKDILMRKIEGDMD